MKHSFVCSARHDVKKDTLSMCPFFSLSPKELGECTITEVEFPL